MIHQDNVWVSIIFVCCFIGMLASYFIPRHAAPRLPLHAP